MTITVSDLDKDIKTQVSSIVTTALFKRYSTLPTEEEKISNTVADSKDALDKEVKDYYRELAERDVDVSIGVDDYRKVYMHLI